MAVPLGGDDALCGVLAVTLPLVDGAADGCPLDDRSRWRHCDDRGGSRGGKAAVFCRCHLAALVRHGTNVGGIAWSQRHNFF